MGTFILSTVCALALNVQSLEAKQDTIHKYVIDKQVVGNFNGSQLEGKTISKYIIAYKNLGNVIEKTHVIYTDMTPDGVIKVRTNGSVVSIKGANGENPTGNIKRNNECLIIVDGKETSSDDFQIIKLNPEKIASINVYKPGSKVADSYGDKGKKGVLVVVTKAGNSENKIIYFMDGQRVDKKVVDNLSPTKIASMKVDKSEGNSVIEITTKK